MSKPKEKAPSFPLYVKDWLSDPELRQTSASTRGIWADLLCYMWLAADQGRLDCSVGKLAKLAQCEPHEIALFIVEAFESEFCSFEFHDQDFSKKFLDCHTEVTQKSQSLSLLLEQNITVINRRIYRTAIRRKSARDRKAKQRKISGVSRECHDDGHAHVTSEKPSPPFPSPFPLDLSEDKSAELPPSGAPDGDHSFPDPAKQGSRKNHHFSQSVGEHFKAIKDACISISSFISKNGRRFNPYQWVQKHINEGKHPGAVAETICAISDQKIFNGIRGDPFGYANSILKTKNQNWNEREAIQIHDELKAMDLAGLKSFTHGLFESI